MKKLISFIFAVIFALSSFAQQISSADISNGIIEVLDTKYAKSNILGYQKINTEYIAVLDAIGDLVFVYFDANDNWLASYTVLSADDVEDSILNDFSSIYSEDVFTDAQFYYTDFNNGFSYYMYSVKDELGNLRQFYINFNGKFYIEEESIREVQREFDYVSEMTNDADFNPKNLPAKVANQIRILNRGFYIRECKYHSSSIVSDGYFLMLKDDLSFETRYQYYSAEGKMVKSEKQSSELDNAFKAPKDKTGTKIKSKEIPDPIFDYCEANYKSLYWTECIYIDNNEVQGVYFFVMHQPGSPEDAIEVYFDYQGEFLGENDAPHVERGFAEVSDEDLFSNNVDKLKVKDLPTVSQDFLKKYLPEHNVKTIRYDEEKSSYFLTVKMQGRPISEVVFDYQGELVSCNDSYYKEQMAYEAEKNKYKRPHYNQTNVPANVVEIFRKKNRYAEDEYWDTINGNYVARYTYEEEDYKSTISPEGVLVEISTPWGLDRLNPRIKDYVKDNYKSYKIEKVIYNKRSDRKHNYCVIVYNKVGEEKYYIALYFSTAAKFLKTKDPWIMDID